MALACTSRRGNDQSAHEPQCGRKQCSAICDRTLARALVDVRTLSRTSGTAAARRGNGYCFIRRRSAGHRRVRDEADAKRASVQFCTPHQSVPHGSRTLSLASRRIRGLRLNDRAADALEIGGMDFARRTLEPRDSESRLSECGRSGFGFHPATTEYCHEQAPFDLMRTAKREANRPLPLGESTMTCSRVEDTMRPSATMPLAETNRV